jgi:hypothetical protein
VRQAPDIPGSADYVLGEASVAELVIEERPLHPFRQGPLDVADLLAHLIPEAGHIGRTGGILQVHEHHGLAGLGVSLQIIKVR